MEKAECRMKKLKSGAGNQGKDKKEKGGQIYFTSHF